MYNEFLLCYVLASTAVTTKKVVKQPKDVAVKKEVLTTKFSKPAVTVSSASTQCINSATTSVTSITSKVTMTIPTPPVAMLTSPAPLVTKNTAPVPHVTKTTVPGSLVNKNVLLPPLVSKSIALSPPVVSKNTTSIPPVTKYAAAAAAATKYTTLTVGSVIQARPLMTSATSLLVSNKAMPHPVVMNIPTAELGKMLGMAHPMMQFTTSEGSQIHSSTVTMSLPPQSMLPTTLVNQKHSESLSQWRPSPSSSVHSNLALISTVANTVITSEMNTSSPNNNNQVLQEHSYQRAENTKSTVGNSLPLSKGNASNEALPKFISPTSSPFK